MDSQPYLCRGLGVLLFTLRCLMGRVFPTAQENKGQFFASLTIVLAGLGEIQTFDYRCVVQN